MKTRLTILFLSILIFLTSFLVACNNSSDANNSLNEPFVPPSNPLEIPHTTGGDYDPGTGYQQVWSDEFDGPDIDTTTWSYETVATGWSPSWNQEWQLYTDNGTGGDNAYIQDGVLILQANMTGDRIEQGAYSSARMVTKGNESWQYGKVAARMALPFGPGSWPALWMLGTNDDTNTWPACGEIDIMEMIGGGYPDRTTAFPQYFMIDWIRVYQKTI